MSKKKTAKKTAKGSKKSKLDSLSQTHGKEEKFQPTTLDQVWGDTGESKYGTLEEKEYKTRLDGMDRSDLFAHATEVGLVPMDNLASLKKRLLSEFHSHVSQYRMPVPTGDKPPKLSARIKKILSEGK
jgi:hypothetical protein